MPIRIKKWHRYGPIAAADVEDSLKIPAFDKDLDRLDPDANVQLPRP
jgi:hypothetical protein